MDSIVLTRRGLMVGLMWLFACGTSKKAVTPMSDQRLRTYEQYLSAWSAITNDERAERLRRSLSPSVVFYNPTQTRRGISEVAGHCAEFQKRTPGGSFATDEMLVFDHHGIVKWHLVDSQGKPGSFDTYGFDYGYDVVEFDSDGRIESIMMFVHSRAAILK
jgi:hypothetical protein